MRKVMTVAALGVALVVSGCGKSENAAGPVKREAGNWKTSLELVKLEAPGMPAELKAGMTQAMESMASGEQCFTQEQIDKEDIAAHLAKGPENGGECTWSKKDVGGGKIDIAGTCTSGGETVDMAISGTFAAKKTDVTTTIKGKDPTGGGDMEIVTRMKGEHTGPCKTPPTQS